MRRSEVQHARVTLAAWGNAGQRPTWTGPRLAQRGGFKASFVVCVWTCPSPRSPESLWCGVVWCGGVVCQGLARDREPSEEVG